MSNKTPKLAVLSQAHPSSTTTNNNNNTITLVVCPKSTTSIRLNESEKQNQYPYYERLCKNYGFSLEVEIVHCQQQQSVVQSSSSSVKRGGSGGPKMSHVLLTSNASTTSKSTSKLQYHSERLIIRPLTTSRSKKSDHQLRPDFQNGDVIQSIDGMNNPTFGMVYAVMMRGDKLLLEIERRGGANSSNRGRSNASSAGAVVGVAGASITNASLEQQETTTTVAAAAATTSKKKRQ
eukprot:scaffold4968_cov81-Skeletonema_marinoi.AAC.2